MLNLVFICTGNICRSPMAEGLLRHRLRALKIDDSGVTSMGTHGPSGQPASQGAQQVCREQGIDISAHRSRTLVGQEIQEADLILTMEPVHREIVRAYFLWHRERVFLLGAWPGPEKRKSAIRDPMGRRMGIYRKVFALIDHHIERILPQL